MDFRAPFTPDEIYQPMRHPNASHLPTDPTSAAANAVEDTALLLNDFTINQYQQATGGIAAVPAGYQQPSAAAAAAAVAVAVQQGAVGIGSFNAQGGGVVVPPLHHKLSASANEFVPNFPPPGIGAAGNGNGSIQNRVQQHYPQPAYYAQQQQQQQQVAASQQRYYNGIQQPKDLNQQQQYQQQQQQQLPYNSNQVGSVQDRLRLVNNGGAGVGAGGNNRNAQPYQQQQQQQQSYYGQHHAQSHQQPHHKNFSKYPHLAQQQQQMLHQQRGGGGGGMYHHPSHHQQQHHQQQQQQHHHQQQQQHHHHHQQQQHNQHHHPQQHHQHQHHHSLQHQKDDAFYNSASGSSGASPSSSAASSSNSNNSNTRNQSTSARSSSSTAATGGSGGGGDSTTSHPDMETIALEYLDTVIHCLNQNPGQFDAIAPRFLTIFEGMENNNYVLSIAMEDIFEKSIENPNFRYMGAKLYNLLHMMNPKRDSLFHTLLKCKLDFHQQEVCIYISTKHHHKVRETALFLAELYMQLRGDDSRIHLIAVNIMHSLKQLLLIEVDAINIRCIGQTLKLAGYDLSTDCPDDMAIVLNSLDEIEKSKPNVYPIIDNVLKLQKNNWGRKVSNSLGEGDSVQPVEPLRMSDEPVFYGPDGRELTAEETDFLADGTAGDDDYDNGGDDDDFDDDDAGELDPEMDEETERSYKDFCKQQRQQHQQLQQQQQQQQRQQYNTNNKKQHS